MHNPRRGSPRPDTPPGASTRRTFLRALAGVAGAGFVGAGVLGTVSGCDLFDAGGARQPHALDGFLLRTAALGDRYDAALAAVPALSDALSPVRGAHRAHAAALAAELGTPTPRPTANAAPAPTDRAEAVAALADAEKTARDEAVAACLTSTPRLAPLLGSIAAARASHLEVLR